MAVTCPLCFKKGKQSKVKCFQINLTEAVVLCENKECTFPLLEGSLTRIVRRDMNKISDPESTPATLEGNNASESSIGDSKNSSQNEPNICNVNDNEPESSKDIAVVGSSTKENGPSMIAAATATSVCSADSTDSAMNVDPSFSGMAAETSTSGNSAYEKFEFHPPPAVGNGVKKKTPRKPYRGRPRRKYTKRSSKVPGTSTEPGSDFQDDSSKTNF